MTFIHRFSTRDTLQDTARLQFEINKKTRRNVFAQAAERGNEWGGLHSGSAPPVPPKMMGDSAPRMRSGSGTSRTTTASDNDSLALGPQSHSSFSPSSSPPQPSMRSTPLFPNQQLPGPPTQVPSTSSNASFSISSLSSTLAAPSNPASVLSPVANRMRERDADAMEKYLRRNRSGSQGTSSTENKSQNGSNYSSAGPLANGEDILTSNHLPTSGSTTPRRLRPSFSAMQLRSETLPSSGTISPQPDSRSRAGTNPTRPSLSPLPLLTRSSSTSTSPQPLICPDRSLVEESETYIGPSSQYARFPDPPKPIEDNTMPAAGRRKAFHLLSKPLPSLEHTGTSHRRGMSSASVR